MSKTRLLLLVCSTILVAFLLMPPLSTPQSHTHRAIRCNQLSEIMLAAFAFESEHNTFPTLSFQGENRLSWRVTLLPYLGEQVLFDKIDKTVAWDHPSNLPFHDLMPRVFQDPAVKNRSLTPFLVVTGIGTGWPESNTPIGFGDITNGASNAISLVALPDEQVNWLSPETLNLEEFCDYIDVHQDSKLVYSYFDGSPSRDPFPPSREQVRSMFLISAD